MKYSGRCLKIFVSLFCTLMIGQLADKPLQAAETVVVRYGSFAESISIAELENIVKTGDFPQSFKSYTNKLSEEQRSLIVGALRTKVPINVATMSNLLSTQIGTTILEDLATVIYREDDAGAKALRESLILGASEANGFSLLSSIAAYPSKRLEIDLSQAFRVFKNLNTAFWQTQQFMSAIAPQLASREPELSLPFDATQPGSGEVKEINLNLNDRKRNRDLPVDIYWSNIASADKPVIIFSHGMGSVRHELRYLALHLASYGFVVAAVEHPGSNEANTNAAIAGKTRLLKPQEFLERPQDISFVIDELEKINKTADNPLKGKLATDKVMVVGYSFGGGTALSIGGARLQPESLRKRCQGNLAILSFGQGLQCIAQELPENSYQLRDERVKSIVALNPTSSLMFGETGLKSVAVPTLVLASSADKTNPALTEQIIGFRKIPSPKWLVGIVGATHLSVKDPRATVSQEGKPNTPLTGGEVIGEQAADIRKFVKAIVLAFAAQLTPEADEYKVFLTADYAQIASTEEFPFRLVTEIPPEAAKVIDTVVSEQ
ncbi:putative dienelactone hydrolase [Rivularia sp. PCC 7116]|uniref:alpha/beta hydrolase n=1 Tax=Rivularia sp. PCC 7116 TaxID=373994 RepID=UPI00029EC8AB|nr:alpha/beta hydrolase [Rivularia sp. PCC 7116]AFY57022.1 putative dienelactone hydrolase [Rivularia sp. PCC 7116]